MFSKIVRKGLALLFLFSSLPTKAQIDWSLQDTPITDAVRDLQFVNDQDGWAYTETGIILRTNDEGENWNVVYDDDSSVFISMHFYDELNGWICGYGGALLKTSDGGDTWSTTPFPLDSPEFDAIYMLSPTSILVATYVDTIGLDIYKSIDGGTSWDLTSFSPGDAFIVNFDFVNDTMGWVAGYSGIYKTDDAGESWSNQSTFAASYHKVVDFVDETHGWIALDSSEIIHNTTGGDGSWPWFSLGPEIYLNDLDMENLTTGYCVGNEGGVYKTEDGLSWAPISFPTALDLNGLYVENEASLWVCGSNGEIWRGSLGATDIIILQPEIADSVCPDQEYPIQVPIHNTGDNFVYAFTVNLYQNTSLINTSTWTGDMAPGDTAVIGMGTYSFPADGTLTVVIEGDTITHNNEWDTLITVYPSEPYGTIGSVETCPREAVEISAWGGISYSWPAAGPNGEDLSGDTVEVQVDQTTIFDVEIAQENCTFIDQVEVVSDECEITNSFSPNGDGINDLFEIDGLENRPNNVSFFNRWGERVSKIENYNNEENKWDGTSGTLKLPAGTYYFTVNYTDGNQGSFTRWVQIVY